MGIVFNKASSMVELKTIAFELRSILRFLNSSEWSTLKSMILTSSKVYTIRLSFAKSEELNKKPMII